MNGNGIQFPYENNCVLAGQVAPKKQGENPIQYKAGQNGGPGRVIVSIKMKREWNKNGQVERRIQFVRLVGYGQAGKFLQDNLQPGMFVRFKGEFKMSWFKVQQGPEAGQFKPNIEFILGRPEQQGGNPPISCIGNGPIEFEQATNNQQGGGNFNNNGGGNGFNNGNNGGGFNGGGNGFNNGGGNQQGGFQNGGNQGGFNSQQGNGNNGNFNNGGAQQNGNGGGFNQGQQQNQQGNGGGNGFQGSTMPQQGQNQGFNGGGQFQNNGGQQQGNGGGQGGNGGQGNFRQDDIPF
jgi:hypothetical protein